jgi:hypothetical protein
MTEADAAAARLQAIVDAHHAWAIDLDMKEMLRDRARLIAQINKQAGQLAAVRAELAARPVPADAAIADAIRRLRAEYVNDSAAWTALSHALSLAEGAAPNHPGPEPNNEDDHA